MDQRFSKLPASRCVASLDPLTARTRCPAQVPLAPSFALKKVWASDRGSKGTEAIDRNVQDGCNGADSGDLGSSVSTRRIVDSNLDKVVKIRVQMSEIMAPSLWQKKDSKKKTQKWE